jgi:hypothetical protein
MTQPPITAPGIHDLPQEPVKPPFTQAQLKAIGQSMRWRFLADVLYAVAGIGVFGPNVQTALKTWADELSRRADDAYRSANYANVQISLLTSGSLASDVPGGVSVSDQFNGDEANNFGGHWSRWSDGPGGGNYGPNGDGLAVWKKFGGLRRRHVDRYDTELATDYQMVVAIMATPPRHRVSETDARTYLCARMDASGETFVFAAIGDGVVEVGVCTSTTFTVWDSSDDVTVHSGDQWIFTVGTDVDDRQVVLRQNGIVRLDYIDDAHPFGADYRGVGVGAQATGWLALDQTVPGELDLWSAADRLPAAA